MVSITQNGRVVVFEVKGLHKLWALKSRIQVARENIVSSYQDEREIRNIRGFRAPGTSIPGIICAGSIIADEGWVFCDFCRIRKTITVALKHEHYKKLYVEVENPHEALVFLKSL